MPAIDGSAESIRRPQAAIVMLLLGVVLIVVALMWPSLPTGNSAWSVDQAREYQSASVSLHELSHKYEGELSKTRSALPPEFRQAKEKFDRLREELDTAQQRQMRIAHLMFFCGVLLAVAGGAIHFLGRHP